ncbi:MAG: hypothetical protein ACNA8W_12815 [Bradymonadaceae bacterium]
MKWSIGALVAGFLLIGSSPVAAQDDMVDPGVDMVDPADEITADMALEDELDDVLADEPGEEGKAWNVSGLIRTGIGQGTFAQTSNDTEWEGEIESGAGAFNRVNMLFALTPSYSLGDFSFSGTIAVVQWLTAGGGMNAPYETRLQDTSLSAGWSGHTFESSKIRVAPSVTLTLPTSTLSRTQTLIADTSASVGISRNFFERLTLSYGLAGGKSFHQYTTPVVNIERIGMENALYRPGGAEDIEPGRIAIGGYNSEYMVGNSLSAGMRLWGDFSASASYGLYTYWTYRTPDADEFTNERSCTGRCTAQITSNVLALSYKVNDWMGLQGRLMTQQPPKTADNKSFRFPFWNFTGAAANYSYLQFAVSGTY